MCRSQLRGRKQNQDYINVTTGGYLVEKTGRTSCSSFSVYFVKTWSVMKLMWRTGQPEFMAIKDVSELEADTQLITHAFPPHLHPQSWRSTVGLIKMLQMSRGLMWLKRLRWFKKNGMSSADARKHKFQVESVVACYILLHVCWQCEILCPSRGQRGSQ